MEKGVPRDSKDTPDEVTSTLAFLCNRFAYVHAELISNPQIIQNLMVDFHNKADKIVKVMV